MNCSPRSASTPKSSIRSPSSRSISTPSSTPARRTGKLLVVDNAWTNCGASAEIVARVVELLADEGKPVKVKRMGYAPTTCPTTPSLEREFYADPAKIAQSGLRNGAPRQARLGARCRARQARLSGKVPRPVLRTLPCSTNSPPVPGAPKSIAAIERVIAEGRFTMGPRVAAFEEAFARYHNSRYAVMVNSGSSANLISVAALFYKKDRPLQRGDEVIVPAISWATTYHPLQQYGLKLKILDVELDTLNMDVSRLAEAVGPRTRAIMGVSILGNPAALDVTRRFADEHGLYFIEDNCESMDAEIANSRSRHLRPYLDLQLVLLASHLDHGRRDDRHQRSGAASRWPNRCARMAGSATSPTTPVSTTSATTTFTKPIASSCPAITCGRSSYPAPSASSS